MPDQKSKIDLPGLKFSLTLVALVLWILQLVAMDEDAMRSISGASAEQLSYWGTKAAGFALIAAVALSVMLIPARSRLIDFLPGAVSALAAIFSGYYWLEEATSSNAGGYIFVVLAAGLLISFSIMVGPAISIRRERKSGNSDTSEA